MCSTCGTGAMSAMSSSININYAENNMGRVYESTSFVKPATPPSGQQQIITPTQAYYKQIPGAPCLQRQPRNNPLNTFARSRVGNPMVNIDGQVIPNANQCLYSCQNSGNNMVVPVPFQPQNSYVIPGAVPSAVRFFKPCGV